MRPRTDLRKHQVAIVTLSATLIMCACASESVFDLDTINPNHIAQHNVYYSVKTSYVLPCPIDKIGNQVTLFMMKYNKFLTSYSTGVEEYPVSYGSCPTGPDMGGYLPIPEMRGTRDDWVIFLKLAIANEALFVRPPSCSKRHVFIAGSYSKNWENNVFAQCPALGLTGGGGQGICLIFWDDINYDLKRSGRCDVAEKYLFAVTYHEMIHQYTNLGHCADIYCVMHPSCYDQDRWIPFDQNFFPFLCDSHKNGLTIYDNRSVHGFCED